MADNLRIFGNTYNNAVGVKMTDTNGNEVTYEKAGETVPEPEPLDVDFIDYDGTLLYTYTAQEFLNLTALPPNPSHDGLTAQGWNWTLADAKAYVRETGFHVIGQNYTTDDGTTRVYITVTDEDVDQSQVIITHGAIATNNTTIDWGDGETSITGILNSMSIAYHTYGSPGDYVIKITSTGVRLGHYGSNNGAFWGNSSNDTISAMRVKKVEIGTGIYAFGSQPFTYCYNLESVSIPTTIGQTENDPKPSLTETSKVKALVLPPNITKIGGNKRGDGLKYFSLGKDVTYFYGAIYFPDMQKLALPNTISETGNGYIIRDARKLQMVNVPTGLTAVPNYYLSSAFKIEEITFHDGITAIGRDTVNGNRGVLQKVILKPTSPPTLENVNSFPSLSSYAKFYVPYSEDHSILNAYKTATNWSTFADRMMEEPT